MSENDVVERRPAAPVSIDEGCMWEGGAWEIRFDELCSEYGGKPCRHCHSQHTVVHERPDRSTYDEVKWTCPRVVVATNEGGHNSTGVCLDCILEAARALDEPTTVVFRNLQRLVNPAGSNVVDGLPYVPLERETSPPQNAPQTPSDDRAPTE